MSVFKREEIAGIYGNEGPIHAECMTEEEWNEMTEDEIITTNQIESDDDIYFCNRCSKQL